MKSLLPFHLLKVYQLVFRETPPYGCVLWVWAFFFLMPDKCQLCFGYIVCSMTINTVIMLELVINIITVNYDKYSAELNKRGWEIRKLIDLPYFVLFLATSSCRFPAGKGELFTNKWLCFEIILVSGFCSCFILHWTDRVVVRKRKDFVFCMLWRKMFLL